MDSLSKSGEVLEVLFLNSFLEVALGFFLSPIGEFCQKKNVVV